MRRSHQSLPRTRNHCALSLLSLGARIIVGESARERERIEPLASAITMRAPAHNKRARRRDRYENTLGEIYLVSELAPEKQAGPPRRLTRQAAYLRQDAGGDDDAGASEDCF